MDKGKLVKILECEEGNLSELQKVSQKTFYDTFIDSNTPEDMEKYLKEN